MLVCRNCGHENPGDALACGKCGTRLSAADFARDVLPRVSRAEGADEPTPGRGAEQDDQPVARTKWGRPARAAQDLPIGKDSESQSKPVLVFELVVLVAFLMAMVAASIAAGLNGAFNFMAVGIVLAVAFGIEVFIHLGKLQRKSSQNW